MVPVQVRAGVKTHVAQLVEHNVSRNFVATSWLEEVPGKVNLSAGECRREYMVTRRVRTPLLGFD